MGDLGPVLAAIVATAGSLLAGYAAARRLGRLGLGDAQIRVNQTLRELADVAEAKADIWQEKYEHEVAARAAERAMAQSDKAETVRKLELTQHDLDDCERQLNNLYSELRRSGQVVDRRAHPREDSSQ